MKLAAIIGVKDEAELVGVAARHMRRIGADVVIVLDLGSEDGSREIAERLCASDPAIRLISTEGALWEAREAYDKALDGFVPDWLMLVDADEFWIPRGGSLKALPGLAESDVMVAERYNVPLTDPPTDVVATIADGRAAELPLIARREKLNEQILRDDPGKRWIMHAIANKVMCRAEVAMGMAPGAHKVRSLDSEKLRTRKTSDVVVAHVPFTSFRRFERKVENARHELERARDYMTGTNGWHWRRWVELADRGRLREEFEAQRIGGAELEASLAEGTIRTAGALLHGECSAER